MSKRKIPDDIEQLINNRLNKRLKEFEERLKEFEDNQKTISKTLGTTLNDEQIFQLFDECNLVMIKSILSNKKDFDINKLYRKSDRHKGITLLLNACWNGSEEVVRLLLAHAATNVNQATTDDGVTPLNMACSNGHEEVVRLLLDHAATDVNQATTDRGVTPLNTACLKGHEGVVRLLLAHAATDVNLARTDNGVTTMDVSCYTCIMYKRSTEIVKYKRSTKIMRLLLYDSRTDRIRPTDEEHAQVYDEVLRHVKSERNARFRGLIRAAIVFKRMRLRAALKIYAPGGTGFEAASASFNNAVSTHN